MKNKIILGLFLLLLISISIVTAEIQIPEKIKKNFEEIWNAITDLQNQINNIELLPGPAGEDAILNIAYITDMSGQQIGGTNTAWTDIPERSLTFTKEDPFSLLKITYTDTLGFNGGWYDGCDWRVMLDGSEIMYIAGGAHGAQGEWVYWHASHITVIPEISAGTHIITVQSKLGESYSEWGYCSAGMRDHGGAEITKGNLLMVEEINQ